MQKVPVPDIDSETLYESIFSEVNLKKKKAPVFKNAEELSSSNRDYIFKRYKLYLKEAPHLERISIVAGISKEFSDILKYIYESDTTFKEAEAIIRSNYREKYETCPFCMLGVPDELDHYLSKSEFPEYTLFPPNLIPCCSRCNKIKSSKFLDEQGRRSYIHFYFDEIPQKPVLLFEYYYTNGRIKTRFKVDDTIRGDEYDLFRRQFEQLSISEHLNKYSFKEITMIFSLLRSTYEVLGMKLCFDEAERAMSEFERKYGTNFYITAVYRGILEDKTKFENFLQNDIFD